MSVRKGDKIIAGSYAIIKPDVYTKEESDELLALKQNKLIAGDNIYIDEETNVISSIGGGMSINVVQTTGTSIDDVMSQSAVTRELEQKIEVEDVAEVALSGKYEDLINKPDLTLYTKTEDLSDVAFTGDYNDLSNIPDYPAIDNLAKVATTNDYNDLDNTPNLTIYDTILSVDRKLELKQNKLTAGQGIIIEDDTISTNVNSAEWGNITGDINAQEDLQNVIQEGLNSKLDTDFDNITEDGISNLKNIVNNGTAMFDTKISDHELTFEESEGWALQGTYVYKTGVAGSRYGYPTFIAKCVEEKGQGTPTEVTLGENTITMYINSNGHQFYDIADKEAVDAWYNTYGTAWYYGVDTSAERVFLPRNKWFVQPTDDVSKLNSVNEAGLPNITGTTPINAGWDTNLMTGAFVAGKRDVFGYTFQGSNNEANTLFDASYSNPIYGNSTTVQPQSLNQLLYICVGNTTVNEALTDVTDITSSENDTLPLGYSTYQADNLSSLAWLKSTGFFESGLTYKSFYNEYRTRIGEKFSGGYVRSVDEDYTDYDLVIDEGNQMFRLPLLDGSECIPDYNNEVSWGEPTEYRTLPYNCFIWYSINSETTIDSAGFYYANEDETVVNEFRQALSYLRRGLGLFLPKGWKVKSLNSGSTLHIVPLTGNGSLYYKVANAVQHLEVVDMLHQAELNNPFFYGMYQYFQTEPNNASWLASLGQWNSKGIYTDYYNWVLDNANESKDYFKLSTEEYTDYDWVVNKTDETFRLPVKVKGASGSAVAGNGIALGLTNGSTDFVMGNGSYAYGVEYGDTILSLNIGSVKPLGSTFSQENYSSTGGVVLGVNTDPTKSGIETSTNGLTLYFYVGEVLQSANLINAGRALEQIARMKVVVETYQNGTSWYRVYSDGWCEQGGRYTMATTGIGTIAFLKPFKDTNYNIFNCKTSTDASSWNVMFDVPTSWTTTGVTIKADLTGYTLSGSWYACGYIA